VLHWRGVPRCHLGEAEGLDDVRRALQLALEQGLGRETAVIYGNLAGMIWLYEGPQASFDLNQEAIAFCERRGIVEVALQGRSSDPTLLAELGRTEQALAEAGPIADRIQIAGDMSWLEPRGVQLRLLAEAGMAEHAPDPEPLLAAAREIDLPGFTALAFAAATQLLLAQGQREHAHALLQKLDQLGSTVAEPSSNLPSLLRTALALEDQPLAQRLSARIEPITPWHEHALASARAQLAEAAGDRVAAAEGYKDAAERWRAFGNVPELAYALLGEGRCLAAFGKPGAGEPLREAKELFTSMGYKPALAETETLLAQTAAA
jgi:hypothetical protein